uniref:Uncharacterized protein n=1 Tax=Oryzias latipes TaxID=8090 RepID=A0A3P9HIE5_ORYLA
ISNSCPAAAMTTPHWMGFQLGTFPSPLRSLMWAELSPRQWIGRRCVYAFPQRSQMYCFPPACTSLWCVRSWALLKVLLHMRQQKGRSVECVRPCAFRLLCWGRSPVWTRWWTFRFTAFRKLFPQRSQVNVLGVCSRFTGF